jgi:hypothetical protein
MNTDTPRTDEAAVDVWRKSNGERMATSSDKVDADFARQLERELATVTAQRDRLAETLRRYAWPCSDAELAHHCASASPSFSVEAQREMKRRNALQSLTPKP